MKIKQAVVIGVLIISCCFYGAFASNTESKNKKEPLKVIRAERFELVDRGGNARILMRTTSRGHPVLSLFDSAGNKRIRLLVEHGIPEIVLFEDTGGKRMSLSLLNSAARLVLFDPKGKARLMASANKDGSSAFSLLDRTGTAAKGRFIQQKDGVTALRLKSNDSAALFAVGSEGETTLMMTSFFKTKENNVIFMTDLKGNARLQFTGEKNKSMVALGVANYDLPGIIIKDSTRGIDWSVP